jgi:hypothetical protein
VGAAVTDNAAKMPSRNLSLFVAFMHSPGSFVVVMSMQIPRRRNQIDQRAA